MPFKVSFYNNRKLSEGKSKSHPPLCIREDYTEKSMDDENKTACFLPDQPKSTAS